MKRLAAAGLALALFTAASAQDRPQDGAMPFLAPDAVREFLVGHPVDGAYPSGRQWSEHMRADASTELREGERVITGVWRFDEEGRLCFDYRMSGSPNGGCFRYVRLGSNCLEHFFKPSWGIGEMGWISNGRLWRRDRPSTCDERSVS
jgi:hypothetical protein